jgi:hypothetical protein
MEYAAILLNFLGTFTVLSNRAGEHQETVDEYLSTKNKKDAQTEPKQQEPEGSGEDEKA